MRWIRKDRRTSNRYVSSGGLWVRDFTSTAVPLDINRLFKPEEYTGVLRNECESRRLNRPDVSELGLRWAKVVIVSDGYDFERRHRLIADLPQDVKVIAINGAAASWKLLPRKPINLFVVNDPTTRVMAYLPGPTGYFPACVASHRTCHEFLGRYLGKVYTYDTTPSLYFGTKRPRNYYVDDYRNPVCAALSLSLKFGASRIALVSCDGAFAEAKSGAVLLGNGLYSYPTQVASHGVVDAMIGWLDNDVFGHINISDYSSGPKYEHAVYIDGDEGLAAFFADQVEEGC